MQKEYSIDRSIYKESLINKAIEDFREVWEIKFIDSEILIRGDSEAEIEEIFWELINYIIWLYNEK